MLRGVLQLMSKTLESYSPIRFTWLIQVLTSSFTSSSSPWSRSNFFCMALFNRNSHFSTTAVSSKSMSSLSIKRLEDFKVYCVELNKVSPF